MADNIDHNSQTLDSLSTFHSIVMISAVTPGIKCTSRIVPHKAVTAEDVAAVAKIGFPFNMNVEMFSVKYGKLPEIGKNDHFRNTDILWSLSWQFEPYNSKIVKEYDQEIPQSQTADNPVAPRGRAAQPSRDIRKTN